MGNADGAVPRSLGLHAAALWRMARQALRERRCRACHAPFMPPFARSDAAHAPLTELLCAACAPSLASFGASACPLCGLPAAEADAPRTLCGACLSTPPPWDALAFHALYDGPLQSLLLRLKFGQDFSLLPPLGAMLAGAAAALPSCDAVMPVPRHPHRLRDKGFNQSHELAAAAARLLNMRLEGALLSRTRRTRSQVRLSIRERQCNPQGSFAARDVSGLRLLLVDDVMTTGATLRHAALALRDAGADAVRVAVVARAV